MIRILLLKGALTLVLFVGAIVLLATASQASATAAAPPAGLAPIDVMDVYLDIVDTNKCCDCHKTIC